MDKIIEILEDVCRYKGDIVEIGAGHGLNTVKFLEVAQRFDKKVLVVDPFEFGWQDMPRSYGEPYTFEGFQKNIKISELGRYCHLLETSSLSSKAEKFLNEWLCFAYIDGLQFKNAVLNDIRIVERARVIVVDDMNRSNDWSQVPQAIKEYMKTSKRKLTVIDRWAVLMK